MLTSLDTQPTLPAPVEDPYSAARVTSVICSLPALWLTGTPELYFGTWQTPSFLNEFGCGLLVLCLLSARLMNPAATAFAAFTNAGIGAWIFFSPWILGFQSTSTGRWGNDMWVGAAIFLFSAFSGSITYRASKRQPVTY